MSYLVSMFRQCEILDGVDRQLFHCILIDSNCIFAKPKALSFVKWIAYSKTGDNENESNILTCMTVDIWSLVWSFNFNTNDGRVDLYSVRLALSRDDNNIYNKFAHPNIDNKYGEVCIGNNRYGRVTVLDLIVNLHCLVLDPNYESSIWVIGHTEYRKQFKHVVSDNQTDCESDSSDNDNSADFAIGQVLIIDI